MALEICSEEDEEEEEDYNESVTTISTPHPHRHHHGEDVELINGTALLPSEVQYQLPSISFQNNYEDLISTPAFVSLCKTKKIISDVVINRR